MFVMELWLTDAVRRARRFNIISDVFDKIRPIRGKPSEGYISTAATFACFAIGTAKGTAEGK